MSSAARTPTGRRIGFVSTRFNGTDGVSLETAKWAAVLTAMGHHCFYFSGQSDLPEQQSRVVPLAFWDHPQVQVVQEAAFKETRRPPAISRLIRELQGELKEELYGFVRDFGIDVLIVENALAIPMHLPLGAALTEFIAETGIPTIGHHHDFFWERKRFLGGCAWDYLNMCFPPQLPSIRHVVINSSGAHQLSLRNGLSSLLVPNVMEFERPPSAPDDYVTTLRADLGVAPDEHLVLQPTRIVQRKGIEHAIELLHRLALEGVKSRLVISHAGGDEGNSYVQRVCNYAELMDVPLALVGDLVAPVRGRTGDGRKIYTLDDVYSQADLVTYPSTIEGFGNAFLEAIYFRRPLVVNSYSIYAYDIKPKGFEVVEFDGFITDDTVRQVADLLERPEQVRLMVDRNYELGNRYYSYGVLHRALARLIVDFFGVDPAEEEDPDLASRAAGERVRDPKAQTG
ncbi:MAG TPA: glycosyltransferase family 4 protein [Chloroflexaceae bacterium]|nr:glycosyltransferase family 4 protein [Chloroflexaceae bacterium]